MVLCISGTLTCGNFERIHYLPNHKLGFVFTPLPQVLFWFVCMPVFVSNQKESRIFRRAQAIYHTNEHNPEGKGHNFG